ncbi:YbhB/YbcL family Raf kinase inhibitor-like protein [Sinomonas atrocyanea]|uniref:YbhB/YbcL family Raf kinase inhibitor-like protein n=1 Tax=Sinomonas atrocyanea TaxID=37927 RepID=UPI00278AE9D4|nr:YbhB/YbcL family Raf kinase inhibitor-like protein [Sinomonas atrocyanea]MDQ0260500.1 Raf kinase inhibitor-like YbhB/YbcL family protein [Sinomonas atrocyanea]MDR6621496.1 Raf kinase inhibitor-like YbhB/YbcL family protein [Sinomonas atrocyanea]
MSQGPFMLTSQDLVDGAELPRPQASAYFGLDGQDLSPQLAWSGAPEGTRSFAVTVMDPDAPRAGSFCHWAVVNIPSEVEGLPEGAGGAPDGMGPADSDAGLPNGCLELLNDAGFTGFVGAGPPRGSGPHRYVFTVHALDVGAVPGTPRSKGSRVLRDIAAHEIAAATITCTYEVR